MFIPLTLAGGGIFPGSFLPYLRGWVFCCTPPPLAGYSKTFPFCSPSRTWLLGLKAVVLLPATALPQHRLCGITTVLVGFITAPQVMSWSMKPGKVLCGFAFPKARKNPENQQRVPVMSLRITFISYLEAFLPVAEQFFDWHYHIFVWFSHQARMCVALPCTKARQLFGNLTYCSPAIASTESHGRTLYFLLSNTHTPTPTHTPPPKHSLVYVGPCGLPIPWAREGEGCLDPLVLRGDSCAGEQPVRFLWKSTWAWICPAPSGSVWYAVLLGWVAKYWLSPDCFKALTHLT